MRLGRLIDFVREALAAGDASSSTPVFLVRRNLDHDIDAELGWSEIPLVSVEVDGDDVDLLGSASSEPATTGALLESLVGLGDSGDDRDVYLRGQAESLGGGQTARIDVPIVAFVTNQNDGVVGLIVEFEGWQETFGPLA